MRVRQEIGPIVYVYVDFRLNLQKPLTQIAKKFVMRMQSAIASLHYFSYICRSESIAIC